MWWDRDLVAGSSFEASIEAAIESARCVVVVWSQHSIESRWCRAEATEGLEREILIPLLLDDVRPPLVFRGTHTADLSGWPQREGELNIVMSAVEQCIGRTSDEVTPKASALRQIGWPLLAATLACVVLFVALGAWWTHPDETPGDEVVAADGSRRVAVLTLRNLSSHPDGEWLAGGLTEELRREIAGWSRFEVLPGALTRDRSIAELAETMDVIIDGYLQSEGGGR